MRPNVYLFIARTCQGFRGNQDHHDKASFRAACHDRAYSDAVDRLGIARAERAADRRPERRTWSRRKAQAAWPGATCGCTPGATRAPGCRTSSTATRAAAARSGPTTACTSATSGSGSATQAYTSAASKRCAAAAYTSAASKRCAAAAYTSASAAPGRSTAAPDTSASAAPGRSTVAACTSVGSTTSGCGTPAPAYTSVGSAAACSAATWGA
jgi:hypothetical protein